MTCPKKKELQGQRTAAWDEYEVEFRQSDPHSALNTVGLVTTASGYLFSPSKLTCLRWKHVKAALRPAMKAFNQHDVLSKQNRSQ